MIVEGERIELGGNREFQAELPLMNICVFLFVNLRIIYLHRDKKSAGFVCSF